MASRQFDHGPSGSQMISSSCSGRILPLKLQPSCALAPPKSSCLFVRHHSNPWTLNRFPTTCRSSFSSSFNLRNIQHYSCRLVSQEFELPHEKMFFAQFLGGNQIGQMTKEDRSPEPTLMAQIMLLSRIDTKAEATSVTCKIISFKVTWEEKPSWSLSNERMMSISLSGCSFWPRGKRFGPAAPVHCLARPSRLCRQIWRPSVGRTRAIDDSHSAHVFNFAIAWPRWTKLPAKLGTVPLYLMGKRPWGQSLFTYGPNEHPRNDMVSHSSLLNDKTAVCSQGNLERDYLHVTGCRSALVSILDSNISEAINSLANGLLVIWPIWLPKTGQKNIFSCANSNSEKTEGGK